MDNKDRDYCVYMHTNKINGKKYIGITCQKPSDRWSNGNGYKNNPHFWSAIQKYGWNNFEHEILFKDLTKEEASNYEIYYIQKFQTKDTNFGYNMTDGGDGTRGYTLTDKQKQHLRDINLGKKLSDEHIEKIRKSNLGKHRSDKTRQKIKDVWYDSKGFMLRSVCQYTLNGNYIKTWKSMSEAARAYGGKASSIVSCCKGRCKTYKGFIWKYPEDTLTNEEVVERNSKIFKNVKRISRYSLDGLFIQAYDNVHEASLDTGVKESCIYRCCSGKRKTSGGYIWKYIDDVLDGDLCA